jgi:HlyD family secretion protein
VDTKSDVTAKSDNNHPSENSMTMPAKVSPLRADRARRQKRRTMGRWLRRGALALLAIGIVGLIVLAWLPKPVQVEVEAARRGPMRVVIDATGRTRVKDRYVISAPLTANLARIELRADDAVKPGDVVARLSPAAPPLLDARARAETSARVAAAAAAEMQSRATFERAKVAAEQARRDLAQNEKLAGSGAISSDALERSRLEQRMRNEELTSASFAAQVASHELEVTRAALRRFETKQTGEELILKSPIAGRVLKVMQPNAALVQAGAPLLELGDPTALEIVGEVLSSDAVHIPRGARVSLERWGGDASLSGHVLVVEPSAFTRVSALGVEEQRVNVIVEIDEPWEKWSRLGDGYRVETRIVVWESEGVLGVPASAAFRHGDGWAVFVDDKGVARRKLIELGRRSDTHVQVLAGLDEGAAVIVHPSERVADGVRIAVR